MIEYNPDVGLSFDECYDKHSGVMYLVCMRFNRKYIIKKKGLEFDDLVSQAKIGFIKAYQKFKASKEKKFTTYMGQMVLGYLKNLYFLMDSSGLHYSDQVKRRDLKRSDEEKIVGSESLVWLDQKIDFADGESRNHEIIGNSLDYTDIYCNEILSLLTPEQKAIVLLLQEGKGTTDIGEYLDVSRQAAHMKIKKIKSIIVEHYKKSENIDLTKIYVGKTNAGREFKAIDKEGNVLYAKDVADFARNFKLSPERIRTSLRNKKAYDGWKFEFVV